MTIDVFEPQLNAICDILLRGLASPINSRGRLCYGARVVHQVGNLVLNRRLDRA
jgi:hypothetical protein